jgi:hypothetical protein
VQRIVPSPSINPSCRAVTQRPNRTRFLDALVAINIAPDTHRDQADGE